MNEEKIKIICKYMNWKVMDIDANSITYQKPPLRAIYTSPRFDQSFDALIPVLKKLKVNHLELDPKHAVTQTFEMVVQIISLIP